MISIYDIPKDIWTYHILIWFYRDEIYRIRLVAKYFFLLTQSYHKQYLKDRHIQTWLSFRKKHPDYPLEIYHLTINDRTYIPPDMKLLSLKIANIHIPININHLTSLTRLYICTESDISSVILPPKLKYFSTRSNNLYNVKIPETVETLIVHTNLIELSTLTHLKSLSIKPIEYLGK